MAYLEFETYPTSAIVPAGGIEGPGNPELTTPSKIRIEALGAFVMGSGAHVNSVYFSGGLEIDGLVEAPAQEQYLEKVLPGHAMRVSLDTACYDTHGSARNVAAMPGVRGKRHLFFVSRSFKERATDIFTGAGVDLVPVDAEAILLKYGNEAQQKMARDYLESPQYRRQVMAEAIGRTILKVDRNGRFSQWLAARKRAKIIGKAASA